MTKLTWLRKNLFNTWYNSALTVICFVLLFRALQGAVVWATTKAQWAVVQINLPLFLVGRFPQTEYWRVWVVLAIAFSLAAITAVVFLGKQRFAGFIKLVAPWLSLIWVLSFPVILWLIGGGFGLRPVSSNLWNGLLLTLFMAAISIVLSFPIGVLLALGRTSKLPVIRWFSILYIEIIRGVPLIGILFLAQVMLPLLLPTDFRLDRVLRAIAGLVLFSAAYMAENVRGGLQSVSRGQVEAAKALGLNTFFVILLIVLPQALRAVIPAIVGQFIGLFKDTSLLSLVGLVELTGISRSILAQPQFIGRYAETYLFVGLIYWLFCYLMSLASRRLEKQLNN
ncbi:Amino acid ABC transporter, permease protein, 3-TM region, His/Glu/Gln/Arg/opine [Nostoc sp. NIES-3756]|uniref:amino acid ABC transporter permease n=1 Tax=Nostoc sp. NIES-3756 TaxID=1751286 RepID=UPI00071FE5B8|nr:amino acid ABC transporter permease [Nostoc sp. NIES-3756]BAT51439.1 Amino acid ABC transporter, permease protein, 3-TM region, His/Glu/Gln/Arg/opine [Nostoc sp. NIES-3756]